MVITNCDFIETGAVFTFGKSRFADNEPSHFFIKNDPVVAISCGDEHSAVICQNGRVFVFGGNSWGQLGLGHKEEVSRPSCVKWLKPQRALFVACGRAHTVFVTDTNAIYTVGCNEEGQLGTGDTESHAVPQYVDIEGEDSRIAQVSAGSNHTAILTENGNVYVCGSNSDGQLGLGEETRTCLKFTKLKFMEQIAFVECGYYHTVFITTDGVVFITGDNESQKLGLKSASSNVYVPEVLPLETPIKSACCGASHTFLLSMDETKILAFGSNEKGQLGFPKDVANITEPTEVDMDKMFDGYQLKLVACGATHTAFVTDNGLLYTCGESRHNKLCLDEVDDAENCNDAVPNQYSPKQVTAMNGYTVDNVAGGGCHTLLTATRAGQPAAPGTRSPLPPLKVPMAMAAERVESVEPALTPAPVSIDVANGNATETISVDALNGNPTNCEDTTSIDSLEANVSGSHIVNINDLENDSTHEMPDIQTDPKSPHRTPENHKTIEFVDIKDIIEEKKEEIKEKIEHAATIIETSVIEETVIKTEVSDHDHNCGDHKSLLIPKKKAEIENSPPPKTPILSELLEVPDITQLSPNISRKSEDSQRSVNGNHSENETIPCNSDKSSPQMEKTAKTQAVLPIVRSEDGISPVTSANENTQNEDAEVVIQKLPEKGRFARMFQAIKDKENSCMSKGKVIENTVVGFMCPIWSLDRNTDPVRVGSFLWPSSALRWQRGRPTA
ncbi:X-linked retinitis pigmentosa GTPase regulator [Eumeta japonica]|uniref:X-linked retinitis pigmentosa GTPase regulator n=1 Tax=Eumeta variegata TaxID=151549 RepID=A0A4C1W4M3_EUMVA|nr:X-linked retinitis pigmentosa GTPase regulator [Eumeta japonica]